MKTEDLSEEQLNCLRGNLQHDLRLLKDAEWLSKDKRREPAIKKRVARYQAIFKALEVGTPNAAA